MTELSVHGYAHNGALDDSGKPKGPREPLVHIMGDRHGALQSIAFHPDDAPQIAEAILAAGRAAKRNRTVRKVLALKLEL
jgi:hypothetical protein